MNISNFEEILKVVDLSGTMQTGFKGLDKKVVLEMKKQKVFFIVQVYKTIKFDYIKRRIKEDDMDVQKESLTSTRVVPWLDLGVPPLWVVVRKGELLEEIILACSEEKVVAIPARSCKSRKYRV